MTQKGSGHDSHSLWLQDIEYRREFGSESAKLEMAAALVRAREMMGLTQSALAELAGTSQAYIAKLERGDANPTIGNIGRLYGCMWLKLSIEATPMEPVAPTESLSIGAAEDIVRKETSIDSDELIAELPIKILAARESLNELENTYEMVQEVNAEAPSIKVFGVGDGGSNAVSHTHKEQLPVSEYWAINTDAQHLFRCDVPNRIAIGSDLGLGVHANPDLGRQAAEESRTEIAQAVEGADLVFIVAGMGGGTGTGASPIVAQIAKESGALTVGVVSRPFSFESATRKKNAEDGIAKLKDHVDTLIVIPNDRLVHLIDGGEQNYTWEDALKMADSVLQQGIQAIAGVTTVPGEINVDFADVRTILSNAGPAWLAIGKGKGENRATDAARMATKSPLLDITMDGARRILFVITGGASLTLQEVQDAAQVIQDMSDPDANIIFGTCRDPRLEDEVKITMVAAAFPVLAETRQMREQELERLLADISPLSKDDLDVPNLRPPHSGRSFSPNPPMDGLGDSP